MASFVRKERKQKFLTKEIFLNLSNATKKLQVQFFFNKHGVL